MNTIFMLMAKHDGAAMISAETCCREYFAPLSLTVFMRKVGDGSIDLPMVRMEDSQKGAKMIHLSDLAAYIDTRRAAAEKELKAMRA